MATAIIKYRTFDGFEFLTEEAAIAHEKLANRCELAILRTIGRRPDLQPHQYLQHDPETALQAKRNILAIVRERGETAKVFLNKDDDIHPQSIAGRILTDGPGPIATAWNRLMFINYFNFREYQQPYFAHHPEEATEAIERQI